MRRLSEDMDQLFGQLIGTTGNGNRSPGALGLPVMAAPVDWVPAIETFQRDGKLIVQADLPGLGADDVTVEVEDELLTISGERREEHEVDDDGLRRTERRYGRFTRSIALPEGVRAEDVQASFDNGVLEIAIPVPQAAQKRRTVDVQSTSQGKSQGASSHSQGTSGTSQGAARNPSGPASASAGGSTS
jgi:HSP20 family protein